MIKINILKTLVCIVLIFNVSQLTAQSNTNPGVSLEFETLRVDNSQISDCGTIDFQNKDNISLIYEVKLSRPSSLNLSGQFSLEVFTVIDGTQTGMVTRDFTSVSPANWTTDPFNNNIQFKMVSGQFFLNAFEFEETGGKLRAEIDYSGFDYYFSENAFCNYAIIKDAVSSFTIDPASLSLACGDTTPRTFTVNDNNPSGTIEYVWNVGGGWGYLGFVRTNFTIFKKQTLKT